MDATAKKILKDLGIPIVESLPLDIEAAVEAGGPEDFRRGVAIGKRHNDPPDLTRPENNPFIPDGSEPDPDPLTDPKHNPFIPRGD